MKKWSVFQQILAIISVFIISRLVALEIGLHMNIWALFSYWQYLDVETLKHQLLRGIWYDHAQPPIFNLFLGIVLKIGGSQSMLLFSIVLKLISLANALLLFSIVKKLTVVYFLPLCIAIAYLISPATLIFECELFYTTFASLLLLLSVFYLIRLQASQRLRDVVGVILPLVAICLTRSVYHITWLMVIFIILIYYFKSKAIFNKLLLVCIAALFIVGGWYVKNKILFGKLTASTWIGMNMARNVFHDHGVTDSNRIEAYEPFSKISVYRKFLNPEFESSFSGLNDRDLLREMKNDSFINETEVNYIPVSDMYQKASLAYIKSHPGAYAKNVFQSSIIYFTPATVYSLAIENADKIKLYDVIYSFNLTHFARGKHQRRILLTISAIPKLVLYFFVFFILLRYFIRSRSINIWNLFIMVTIAFIFGVSSFFEHYENMRFRFETEPLFLILAAQAFSRLYARFEIKRKPPLHDLIAY